MANTLLIRYHRIGDGIIVLPLIMALASKYKDDHFTVLTNARFIPLAETMPSNVSFIPMVTRKPTGAFRGISYLIRKQIFRWSIPKLLKTFDNIVFLQNDKVEEQMKRHLLRRKRHIRIAETDEAAFIDEKRLENRCTDGMTIVEQHRKALAKLGYVGLGTLNNPAPIQKKNTRPLKKNLGIDPNKKLIAISPFSKEKAKIYPMDRIEQVIAHFAKTDGYQVLLFGGGSHEETITGKWAEKYPNVISLVGKLPFIEEMAILAKCSLELAMDSANLHFAAFLDVPVVSIWGSTLPRNGYFPENVPQDHCVVKGLPCQPCSLFGQAHCTNPKPYDCLDISPETVIAKMEDVLDKK